MPATTDSTMSTMHITSQLVRLWLTFHHTIVRDLGDCVTSLHCINVAASVPPSS